MTEPKWKTLDLPTPGEVVLTYSASSVNFYVAFIDNNNVWHKDNGAELSGVTHWAPLPKAPGN